MRRLLPMAAAAILAAGCATTKPAAPPPPPPGGLAPAPVATTPSAAAAAELARLRAQAATTPPARSAEAFEKLARAQPTSAEAPEALDEAGRAWMKAKQPARAARAWAELLSRYPLSPRAEEARLRYGLAEVEAGNARVGMPTLQSIWDRTPEAKRGNLALRIADAAEAAPDWPLAARWRDEAAAWVPQAERPAQLARAREIVATKLSPQEAEALLAQVPREGALGVALAARVAAARPQAVAGTLGVAVPLSGKFKGWGEAILQGVAIALPEGGPLRVVAKDTRGEPDGAAEAVAQLAAEGALAIVGGVTNAEAPRAAAAAQQAGVPLLSLSKVDGVTEGRPYVFRLMLTASAQAQALAELLARRRLERSIVLYPEIPYGTELKAAFTAAVEARGGAVVRAVGYEADRANFSPMVKELVGRSNAQVEKRADWREAQRTIAKEIQDPYRRAKALEKARKELPPQIDFDVVFVPDFARTVTLLAPTLAVEDVVTACDPAEVERIQKVSPWTVRPVLLLGANGWDDPAIVEKAARYVECAVFVDGFFPGSERAETRRFVEAFQKAHARPPTILEASAHDAAAMVAQALAAGAGGRKEMRDALAGQRPFPGATGEVTFDARGEPVRALFFLTVDKGVIRELRPEEISGMPTTAP